MAQSARRALLGCALLVTAAAVAAAAAPTPASRKLLLPGTGCVGGCYPGTPRTTSAPARTPASVVVPKLEAELGPRFGSTLAAAAATSSSSSGSSSGSSLSRAAGARRRLRESGPGSTGNAAAADKRYARLGRHGAPVTVQDLEADAPALFGQEAYERATAGSVAAAAAGAPARRLLTQEMPGAGSKADKRIQLLATRGFAASRPQLESAGTGRVVVTDRAFELQPAAAAAVDGAGAGAGARRLAGAAAASSAGQVVDGRNTVALTKLSSVRQPASFSLPQLGSE